MNKHISRKRFGQHFLVDHSIIERIIATINPLYDEHIIEIGPGQGAITVPLLEKGVWLKVVELDRDLLQQLEEKRQYYPRLRIIHQDALTLTLANHTNNKIRVVGNLPYNISNPFLFRCFKQLSLIKDMVFMLQQEVVDRLCAEPGESNYSRLSVMCQFYCGVTKRFDVAPEVFDPPPKIMSSIISLYPKPSESAIDECLFSRLVQQAFSQRRKMLRNNLDQWLNKFDYEKLGVNPEHRAQDLTLDNYKKITRTIMERSTKFGAVS